MELLKKLVLFSCMVLCIGTMAAMDDQENAELSNNGGLVSNSGSQSNRQECIMPPNLYNFYLGKPTKKDIVNKALFEAIIAQDWDGVVCAIEDNKDIIEITEQDLINNKLSGNDVTINLILNKRIEKQEILLEQKQFDKELRAFELKEQKKEISQRMRETESLITVIRRNNREKEKDNKDQLK